MAARPKSSNEEAVGNCIYALLSLSSPKCEPDKKMHEAPALVEERPAKVPKRSASTTAAKGVSQPSLDPGAEAWLHQWVELVRGKYEGRKAYIVGMTAKKFRVRVMGVEHQLEFYPSMFKQIQTRSPTPEKSLVMEQGQGAGPDYRNLERGATECALSQGCVSQVTLSPASHMTLEDSSEKGTKMSGASSNSSRSSVPMKQRLKQFAMKTTQDISPIRQDSCNTQTTHRSPYLIKCV